MSMTRAKYLDGRLGVTWHKHSFPEDYRLNLFTTASVLLALAFLRSVYLADPQGLAKVGN
jgi:hypothetical protein